MNKRRLIEWGKTLLIMLLALSAVRLTGMIGLLDFLSGGSPAAVGNQQNASLQINNEVAARPITIVITSAENAHHGVKYDGEALGEIHSWLSATAGEAMGSSGAPETTTVQNWEKALHGEGVYFDFIYEQSIASMARWLGVEIGSDLSLHTARRFCLAVEGNEVNLYYIRALDGKAYRCGTALNASRLSQRLEGYMPNGAMFAFELGDIYGNIDPYYCIVDDLGAVSALAGTNPLSGSDGAQVLNVFGMNRLVANHYPESDGTHVYVEGEQSLRLSADGRILYNRMQGDEDSQLTLGTADAISMAYSIASSLPGGDGRTLQMSAVSYDQSGNEYSVRFDYLADGTMVCFGGRVSAMEIVISGSGQLRRADIMCRSYAVQGTAVPMPERQALAVIGSMGGGEPMLCYADSGESVELKWVIKH